MNGVWGLPLHLLQNSMPQDVDPSNQGSSRALHANWTHTMHARVAK